MIEDERFTTVFYTLSGSRSLGIHTENSDWDYLGAAVENPEYVLGLKTFDQRQFDYEYDCVKHEGTVYSLRKYINLLIAGNPTILNSMYCDPLEDKLGICTDEFRSHAVSRLAGPKFLGYAKQQLHRLQGLSSAHVTRAHLIEKYGYDTKYAGHLIRLVLQGMEYLTTGDIYMPMDPVSAQMVVDIRNGAMTLEQFVPFADLMLTQLELTVESSTLLPEEPDYAWMNEWLVKSYRRIWDENEQRTFDLG